ncbi:MAG: glycosyltransferase family 4 protein [Candidatus Hodarchaeota archaeon]
MRIGYVLNNFPSLSESFVLNELFELIKNNVEIYIFSLHYSTDDIRHTEYKEYNFLKKTFYFLIDAKKVFKYLKYFIVNGISLWNLLPHYKRIYKKIGRIMIASEFAELAKNLNLDLIHAHHDNNAEIAAYFSRLLKIPFTFTKHIPTNLTNFYKILCKQASGIVTISDYNRKVLIQLGVDQEKIWVIPCGIDIEKFKNFPQYNKNSISLLSVARLVEKKGLKYIIKAMPMIIKRHNVALNIIGKGPKKGILINLAKKIGVENKVNFIGTVSDNDLINLYKTSSIFVLPCVYTKNGDVDGIPVAIMEAMAMGLPVISTSVSGIPEIIDNYQNGILVKPKNPLELSKAVIHLLDNPKLCKKYGENGRLKIQNKFNIINNVSSLKRFFMGICAK